MGQAARFCSAGTTKWDTDQKFLGKGCTLYSVQQGLVRKQLHYSEKFVGVCNPNGEESWKKGYAVKQTSVCHLSWGLEIALGLDENVAPVTLRSAL